MSKTYIDYGHGKNEVRLWAYKNGDIRYSPVVVGNSTTHFESGFFVGFRLGVSGRVDLKEKKITIGGLGGGMDDDIKAAKNILKMDYPDFKIINFAG